MPLHPDVSLGITLSAIMGRAQFTHDPEPVVAELREAAGRRTDLLREQVGLWVGFNSGRDTRILAEALLAEFADLDLGPWIEVGRQRRAAPGHGTHDFIRT